MSQASVMCIHAHAYAATRWQRARLWRRVAGAGACVCGRREAGVRGGCQCMQAREASAGAPRGGRGKRSAGTTPAPGMQDAPR